MMQGLFELYASSQKASATLIYKQKQSIRRNSVMQKNYFSFNITLELREN